MKKMVIASLVWGAFVGSLHAADSPKAGIAFSCVRYADEQAGLVTQAVGAFSEQEEKKERDFGRITSAGLSSQFTDLLKAFEGSSLKKSESSEQLARMVARSIEPDWKEYTDVLDPLSDRNVYSDPFAKIHKLFFESKYEKAITGYVRTLRGNEGTQEQRRLAEIGLGESYLATGNLEEGFKWREARITSDAGYNTDKLWDGKADLNNKTIFIRPEGGFGDIAFFQLRYILILQKVFPQCHIVLEGNFPQRSIYTLLKNVVVNVEIVNKGTYNNYDYALYGMSLPRYFSVNGHSPTTRDSIPTAPYIQANPALVQKWQVQLQESIDKGIMPIGIFWGASLQPGGVFRRYERNIDPKLLVDSLNECGNTRIALFNLQGPGSEQVCKDNSSLINLEGFDGQSGPFQDTAAFMQALSNVGGMVVGIDTGALNFAGGVFANKEKVLALLPAQADWRWGVTQKESRWLSATLLRQQTQNDWTPVIKEMQEIVRQQLVTFANKNKTMHSIL